MSPCRSRLLVCALVMSVSGCSFGAPGPILARAESNAIGIDPSLVHGGPDGPSDLVLHRVTFEPGATNGWHSHPGTVFVAVVSGAFTLHTVNAKGCAAQTFTAGEGFFEHPDAVHLGRNEGPERFEVYVTYIGIPTGAPLFEKEPIPEGPNCVNLAASTTGIARTELARATIADRIPLR